MNVSRHRIVSGRFDSPYCIGARSALRLYLSLRGRCQNLGDCSVGRTGALSRAEGAQVVRAAAGHAAPGMGIGFQHFRNFTAEGT
jgi:hypothetical protein